MESKSASTEALYKKESTNEIIDNLVFLAKNITHLDLILISLIQNEVISEDESQVIVAHSQKSQQYEKSDLRRNYELLSLIQKKGWSRVRSLFLQILKDTGNAHCVEKIEGIPITFFETEDNIEISQNRNRKKISIPILVVVLIMITIAIAVVVYWVTHLDPGHENEACQNISVHSNNGHKKTKHELVNYLKCNTGFKTISGVYVTNERVGRKDGIEAMERIAGVLPGVMTTNMPHYSSNATVWQLYFDEVISNWKNNSFVHIRWIFGNPFWELPDFCKTFISFREDEERWEDLIRDGGYLNKKWKNILDQIAPYFIQLQNEGVIPVCDFLPSVNRILQNIWSGRKGVNGTVVVYRMTHDYLVKHHGLYSLVWVWSLDILGDLEDVEEYWPGKYYVDVASVFMNNKLNLTSDEYDTLFHVLGYTPASMEWLCYVPTLKLLNQQPKWAWFTVVDTCVEYQGSEVSIRTLLQSDYVINRGDIDFFNTTL